MSHDEEVVAAEEKIFHVLGEADLTYTEALGILAKVKAQVVYHYVNDMREDGNPEERFPDDTDYIG